ncbi:hypothetical protein O8I71_07625, partial [Campylobacter lari]|uniref:hypothetical protein n=1 Tax=Campylobacter lari TaxID=201 RepID=UPI0037279131
MIWKEDDLVDILKTDNSIYKVCRNNEYYFDLQQEVKLECITIQLKNNFSLENIQYSNDSKNFNCFEKKHLIIQDNIITLVLSEEIPIRYLKIKDEILLVRLFVRKFPLLFIAARNDGLGARLSALLNAIYLSDKFGCKFGFVWKYRSFPTKNTNSIKVPFIVDEKYMFTKDFIEKYSYTNILNTNGGNLVAYMDLGKFNINNRNINRLMLKPYMEKWGWFTPFGYCYNLFENITQKEYFEGLRKSFKKIFFHDKIMNSMKVAKSYKSFFANKRLVNIHIRSSELIYTQHKHFLMDHVAVKHLVTIEMVMYIIEQELDSNSIILLCGDDFNLLSILERFYNKKNIIILSRISEKYNFSELELLFFELKLRSYSEKIYSTKSAFGILPYSMGHCKDLIDIYDFLYSQDNLYEKIKNISNKAPFVDKYYKGATNFFLFTRSLNTIDGFSHIKICLRNDKDNFSYKMCFFYYLIMSEKYKEADKFLSVIFRSNFDEIKKNFHMSFFACWRFIYNLVDLKKCYFYNFLHLQLLLLLIFKKNNNFDNIELYIDNIFKDDFNKNSIIKFLLKDSFKTITNQTTQIQNLSNAFNQTIKEKDNIINSNTNHINQLQSNIQEKS